MLSPAATLSLESSSARIVVWFWLRMSVCMCWCEPARPEPEPSFCFGMLNIADWPRWHYAFGSSARRLAEPNLPTEIKNKLTAGTCGNSQRKQRSAISETQTDWVGGSKSHPVHPKLLKNSDLEKQKTGSCRRIKLEMDWSQIHKLCVLLLDWLIYNGKGILLGQIESILS